MAGPGKVLARVNGVNIYQFQISMAEFFLFGAKNPYVHADSQTLEKEVLKSVIDLEILFQDAQKRGIEPDERLVNKFVWNFKAGFPSLAEYQSALDSMHAKEKDIEDLARRLEVMGACIKERYGDSLTPGETEAKQYYQENPRDFTLPQAVRVQHILVEKGAGADRKAALARAQKILARIKKGAEPFATIARKTSDGPEKAQGGDMGYVVKGALRGTELEPLGKTIFNLRPGETGGPVETGIGFHIVKALDKRPETVMPFEAVRERLIGVLEKRNLLEAVHNLASELRPGFDIEMTADP